MYYVEFAMGTIIGQLMFTPQETSNVLISAAFILLLYKVPILWTTLLVFQVSKGYDAVRICWPPTAESA